MNAITATFPDLEFPLVVTSIPLPNPHNHPASAVTGPVHRVAMLDLLQSAQLDAVVEKNRSLTDLFGNYLRAQIAYANSSFAVTVPTVFAVQLPTRARVPARQTPFGHLNFLASPIEGLYLDPDDVFES